MKDPNSTHTRPIDSGGSAPGHRSWRTWLWPRSPGAQTTVPDRISAADTAAATAGHQAYLAEVQQLVDDQSAVLFRLVTAAAAQASTATQPIEVTQETRTLTASVGAHAALFHIEAITDRRTDLGGARTYLTGQARCLVPTPDGTPAEWVLARQRTTAGDTRARGAHTWVDGKAEQPVTEAVVVSRLRALFP